MNISSPLLMNPANLGNHNQLTAPLLLWCRAAGLWSFLTWLPLMLMNSDWWWVSVAHWIEWLSSASLLAREDRCMLQQASDRCQQRAVTRETSCALRSHSCYTCNCTEVKLCYFFFLSDSFFFLVFTLRLIQNCMHTASAVDTLYAAWSRFWKCS